MNIFIEAYCIALFIFIHFSLLLCQQPTCFFDARQVLVLPSGIEKSVFKLFSLIPIKLQLIQLVAQFCLFGDVVLLLLLVVKIVGNIIKNMLIILGITCLIMLVLYGVSNYDSIFVEKVVSEAKNFINNILKQSPIAKGY